MALPAIEGLTSFTYDAYGGNPDYSGDTFDDMLDDSEPYFAAGVMSGGAAVWFSVDFGVPYTLDRVDIGQYGALYKPTEITVQKSDNGTDWVDVAVFDDFAYSGYNLDSFVFTAATARYWRFLESVGSGSQYWRIYDFEPYGKAFGSGALDTITHEMDTTRTHAAAGWVTVTGGTIDASELSASTKYAAIARWRCGYDDANGLAGVRLSSADDADLATYSTTTWGRYSNQGKGFMTVSVFDTAATPSDIVAEFFRDAGTVTVYDLSILLIDLDALDAGDYLVDQGTPGTEAPTSWTAYGTLDGADLGIGEEWLVFGQARMNDYASGYYWGGRLSAANDADSAAVQQTHYTEGEESTADPTFMLLGRHKTLTAEVDATLELRESSTIANAYIRNFVLFAIKTSVFGEGSTVATNVDGTTIGTTPVTVESVSSPAGGVVVLSSMQGDASRALLSSNVDFDGTALDSGDVGFRQNIQADASLVELEISYTMDFPVLRPDLDLDLEAAASDTAACNSATLAALVIREPATPVTRPTFRTDLRWVGDSAMIVYDQIDAEYDANPFPPVGSVFRNYDPDGNTFPNTNLYSPDLLELIVTLVDEYEANDSADALTVAKMLTAHAVESLKTDLATYTYPLTMIAERYTYSSGWNKSEGDGAEYHMRTTLLAAYAFLRMFANDTADYDAKDLSEWALEMLDTGRKMQQFSNDRADGSDMPTWMSGSMSEWWNEGASNTTPQWAYHPLFLTDVVWLAYTEAITQLGDTQDRRDTGTYLLSDVRDDYIAFVEEGVENRDGLMSDTDGGYVALPYQRFHADGAGAATPMNIYTPASSTPSATADWTSDAMFWTTEGMVRAGESQGAAWLATLEALRHGTPSRYYDSYTVSGGATTSPAAAEEVTQASALNARVAHVLGRATYTAWIEASQMDEADQVSDGAWTWVGNATDYVEAIATAVCFQAIIIKESESGPLLAGTAYAARDGSPVQLPSADLALTAGDVILFFGCRYNCGTNGATSSQITWLTDPTYTYGPATDVSSDLGYRIVDDPATEPTNYEMGGGAGYDRVLAAAVFQGLDVDNLVAQVPTYQGYLNSPNPASLAVTPDAGNQLVVQARTKNSTIEADHGSAGPPSGYTSAVHAYSASGGDSSVAEGAYLVSESTAEIAAGVWSNEVGSGAESIAAVYVLNALGGGGGGGGAIWPLGRRAIRPRRFAF